MGRKLIETAVRWGIVLESRRKIHRDEVFAEISPEDVMSLIEVECRKAGGRLGWLSMTCRYAKENDEPDHT